MEDDIKDDGEGEDSNGSNIGGISLLQDIRESSKFRIDGGTGSTIVILEVVVKRHVSRGENDDPDLEWELETLEDVVRISLKVLDSRSFLFSFSLEAWDILSHQVGDQNAWQDDTEHQSGDNGNNQKDS